MAEAHAACNARPLTRGPDRASLAGLTTIANHHRERPMSPVKLYGIPRSRAFRCLLALEETGIPYELVATDYREGCKTDAFRQLNPNAKIPVLVDGDLCLWESLAINLYLFRKSGTLWPKSAEDEARLFQWTLWTATEAEPAQGAWFYNTKFLPPEERDPKKAEEGAEKLRACLAVLDRHLADRAHLCGEAWSAADLQVSSVLYTSWANGFDYGPHPRAKAWLERCLTRPAALKARGMREAA